MRSYERWMNQTKETEMRSGSGKLLATKFVGARAFGGASISKDGKVPHSVGRAQKNIMAGLND
jgi:hypothetical protein